VKETIRKTYKSKRREMSREDVIQKSCDADKVFLNSDIYKNSKLIMLYMPIGNETDTSHIIKRALADGKELVFPVTAKDSGEITPYYATKDTEFSKGAFSVREPLGTKVADESFIDVVLVPGIAFDRKGNRIGFGKGCYDKFLSRLNAVFVGFCYEFQVCDEIASDEHDIRMDYIITENGLMKC